LDKNGFKRSESGFEQNESISVHFDPFSFAGMNVLPAGNIHGECTT